MMFIGVDSIGKVIGYSLNKYSRVMVCDVTFTAMQDDNACSSQSPVITGFTQAICSFVHFVSLVV